MADIDGSDYALRKKIRENLENDEPPEPEEERREREKRKAAKPVSISSLIPGFIADLDKAPERRIPTHLSRLNWLLDGGFAPGELAYLAARAKVGKTSLALQFSTAAARAGYATLVDSHEMRNSALLRRYFTQESGVSASRFRRKEFKDSDYPAIMQAAAVLGDQPIFMMDQAQTFKEIEDAVMDLKETDNLEFLIIDYLQRISTGRKGGRENRRLDIEELSSNIKDIAQQTGISILCMSAVTRGDPTKRITVSSLRETGNLEHDADMIFLLHRDGPVSEAELEVAMNRDGAAGMISLDFVGNLTRFEQAPETPEQGSFDDDR